MAVLNIPLILTSSGLTEAELAARLFPEHRYPKLALKYLVKSGRELKATELEVLASAITCPLSAVVGGSDWKASISKGWLVFYRDDFEAVYDSILGGVTLLHKGKVVANKQIVTQSTTIADLFGMLESLIAEYTAQK